MNNVKLKHCLRSTLCTHVAFLHANRTENKHQVYKNTLNENLITRYFNDGQLACFTCFMTLVNNTQSNISRTSEARTLMAYLPRLSGFFELVIEFVLFLPTFPWKNPILADLG